MLVQTRIFELSYSKYNNLSQLAQAMGISVSQVYRVRQGKRNINQKFIVGAMKAFPGYRFDDLFYLAPEVPIVINNQCPEDSTKYSIGDQERARQQEKAAQQTTGVK